MSLSVRQIKVAVCVVLAAVAFAGASSDSLAAPAATQSGGGPRLTMVGPTRAGVGQPFTVTLIARGATDLAGYEATLRFDPKALVFGGAEQRDLGLASTGRGVESLGPVERPDGVVIGAWSCATPDCVTRAGRRATRGPKGTVVVAHLSFTTLKAGAIKLSIDRVVLVNSHGQQIKASTTAGELGISSARQGKSAAGTRTFAVPALRPDGRARLAGTAGHSPDINGDGLVTHADVMEASIAWVRARETSSICGAAARTVDVNGDGCVDVVDAQRVANAFARRGAHATPTGVRGSVPGSIPGGGPIVVNSIGDAVDATPGDGVCRTANGDCTLRAAITEANRDAGPDEIDFAIPGAGVHTITLASPLPTLSDETGGTTIDGYTQAGAAVNTAAQADNAQLMVQLTGTTDIDAITITSAGNVIRGLAIFNLHRGFWLTGAGAQNNVISGSFIGENAAGSYQPPAFVNSANGVSLNLGAASNTVGLATLAGRNVISGNGQNGIWFYDEGTDHNQILNAIIGLSPDGTTARSNAGHGLDVNAIASYNTIGGSGDLQRNVISGNGSEGIEFSHNRMTNENRAVNNFIGTDLTGEASPAYAANGAAGIHFEDGVTENSAIGNTIANSGCNNYSGNIAIETSSDGNVIKGNHIGISVGGHPLASCLWGVVLRTGATRNQIGPGNEIANNPIGVWVDGDSTDQNTISRNSMHDNGSLGIDLSPLGATANDANDADTGPDQGLNTPVIAHAGTLSVAGSACAACRVELFRTGGAAGAHGDGREYLLAVTTSSSGAFNIGVPGLNAGDVVTATATDADGNTSEYAANVAVVADTGGTVTVAADAFGRTTANAWGSADTGGAWTASFGSASDYQVAAGAGSMRFTGAVQNRAEMLNGASAQDVDMRVTVSIDKPAAGGTQWVYAVLRHQGAGTDEYRAKLRYDTAGKVGLNVSRVVGGVEQDIGTFVIVPVAQGVPVQLRAFVSGTNPTTLRLKAWAVGTTEPADWQLVVTDATPSLQGAGTVGLRGYLGNGTTNAPVTYSFDDYSVTTPGAGSPPPPPPPPPDPTDYANDTFSRVTTDTWGRADWGGVWAVSTNAPDYDTDGGRGTMLLSAPGMNRAAYLAGVSATDVDLTYRFSANSAATGSGLYVYSAARRVSGGTEYRIKVRITATGAVYIQATRVIRNVETSLGAGPETLVSGLTFVPGKDLMMHAQVTGTSPTTIKMRVWSGDGTEPTTWQWTGTDSTAALQAPGAVGLRSYLSGNATHGVLVSLDNFRVIAP